MVRLKGVDAPEMDHEGGRHQYFAREARQGLRRLVLDTALRMDTATMTRDRFDRILAEVWLPDGRLLNQVLVRQGLAFFYPHPRQKLTDREGLLSAQKQAMLEGQGFWARILSMREAGETFIGNRRSRRFHRRECPYGRGMSRSNHIEFPSLRQAFAAGYAPCRECTPWPDGG